MTDQDLAEVIRLLHTFDSYLGLIIHRGTDLRYGPNGEDDKPQLEADRRAIRAVLEALSE